TSAIFTLRLYGAGSESGPYITAVRSVEVPPGIAQQPWLRRPGTAPQYFVCSKPRLRVLAVGIDLKSGIRAEVRCSPFPNVADHLPASKSAVAGRERSDIQGAHCPPSQVGML